MESLRVCFITVQFSIRLKRIWNRAIELEPRLRDLNYRKQQCKNLISEYISRSTFSWTSYFVIHIYYVYYPKLKLQRSTMPAIVYAYFISSNQNLSKSISHCHLFTKLWWWYVIPRSSYVSSDSCLLKYEEERSFNRPLFKIHLHNQYPYPCFKPDISWRLPFNIYNRMSFRVRER